MAQKPQRSGVSLRYRYIAKNIDGETIRGSMVARDMDALYDQLLGQGLYLQSATKTHAVKNMAIKPKDLADFNRQLSGLLGAGVSLARALTIISEEEGLRPELKERYEAILADVRRGVALSDALEVQGVFPEIMLGMVRAGEGTGTLAQVTERLAIHFTKQHQLEQQIKSALFYPMILAILAVAVVLVIMTFVLPQFEDLFSGMAELPAPTRILMAFSDFLIHKWYLLVMAVVAIVVVFRIILSIPNVKFALDKLKLRLPLFGPLFRVIYTARFARTLSSLYSSGVPIVSALSTGRDTIGNTYIASQFDDVLTRVRSGETLSAALEPIDGFRPKLASTIRVGEETGQLDNMLNSVAETMEYDAEQATKRMMTTLEPILIVIMALAVGFIMVAVMMPIISSYGSIEGAANI